MPRVTRNEGMRNKKKLGIRKRLPNFQEKKQHVQWPWGQREIKELFCTTVDWIWGERFGWGEVEGRKGGELGRTGQK